MPIPQSWQAEAYNQVPESENRIHSDEIARRHGFRGGLVPGVTVTAYLCHPAVDAWGMDWLARGRVRAAVSTPLYDRKRFRVELTDASARAYDAVLTDEDGTRCATASAELPESLRNTSEMPELLRPDGGGYANPAFSLGLTNWALVGNVRIEAWLHLQTESQNYRPIPRDSELLVESAIADLFEKKGNEFVDLDVAAYLLDTQEPVMSARLRAIYQLRGSP